MKENKRKINKLKVSIVLLSIILLISMSVFGRYIYNSIRDMYLASKSFYFSSNLLTVNGAKYNFNNWNGEDVYEIPFELYSAVDDLRKANYDLTYNLECSVSDETKAKCTIGSTTGPTSTQGIIYKTQNNTAEVKLYVTPLTPLEIGDSIEISIIASTEEPYEKEISATYTIEMTEEFSSYQIIDEENQDYLTLKLVNSENIEKTITVSIDPTILKLDMNDEIYTRIISSTTQSGYINSITFLMTAESSKNIKFYKVDSTQNYTYPNAGNTSIIEVEAE